MFNQFSDLRWAVRNEWESDSHDRTSRANLRARHRALGSGLEDWNALGTAWEYSADPNDEYDPIREAAVFA